MTGVRSAYERFMSSLEIGYDEWRDGTGYDLEALRQCSTEEKRRIESALIERGITGWRDLEALRVLNTGNARAALRATLKSKALDLSLRAAELLDDEPDHIYELESAIAAALTKPAQPHVLVAALDAAARLATPNVRRTLFHVAKHGGGWLATRAAGLVFHLHGQADEPFAAAHRDLFTAFGNEARHERMRAFHALCARLGVNPADYP